MRALCLVEKRLVGRIFVSGALIHYLLRCLYAFTCYHRNAEQIFKYYLGSNHGGNGGVFNDRKAIIAAETELKSMSYLCPFIHFNLSCSTYQLIY